jgi:hypothetical protein
MMITVVILVGIGLAWLYSARISYLSQAAGTGTRRLRLFIAAVVTLVVVWATPALLDAALTSTSTWPVILVPQINRNVDMLLALRRAAADAGVRMCHGRRSPFIIVRDQRRFHTLSAQGCSLGHVV